MKFRSACVIALMLALGAAPGRAQQAESVAVVVNDEVISTFDVRMRSALILVSAGIPASPEAMKQVRGQALRSLVDERLEIQEAKDKKITVTPAEVDKALQGVAAQNHLTVDKFAQQLAAAGSDIQTLRTQIEAEIAWRRLINARYGSRLRVSDAEIQNTLDRIRANASKPQYQISEIVLPAESEKDFQDAEVAAGRLLKELQGGHVSFAAVAQQFSAAPSAAAGGDLGWLAESELRPDLLAAVRVLKPGQVSNPIRVPNGVEIIALRAARAGIDPKTAVRMRLQQISAPAKSRDSLDSARQRIRGCDDLERAVHNVNGHRIVDMGETAEGDLADSAREAVAKTQVGRASPVFDSGDGASTIVVCSREMDDSSLPSRDVVENRMMDDELALLSQRYLMDLRRESTIITR